MPPRWEKTPLDKKTPRVWLDEFRIMQSENEHENRNISYTSEIFGVPRIGQSRNATVRDSIIEEIRDRVNVVYPTIFRFFKVPILNRLKKNYKSKRMKKNFCLAGIKIFNFCPDGSTCGRKSRFQPVKNSEFMIFLPVDL